MGRHIQTQATALRVSQNLAVQNPLALLEYKQVAPNTGSSGALEHAMLSVGVVRSFSRNKQIFGDEGPANQIYKVLAGTVCTYKILSDGRRHINSFYLADESFALEHIDRHDRAAEAISDAKILVVKRAALMALASSDAAVARQLLMLTARELARVQDRVLLLAKTAEERVAWFILEMAKRSTGDSIELPMLRQDIADYLGLTIETVSRTLKFLKDHGGIEVSTRQVVLRNRSTLRRING
ncbi:MAG: helix-turn-helix domain-containing protein [Xanthobacteraceae bacterium]